VSTPFGGVSWESLPNVEQEALTRLVAVLEDRRVLYNPMDREIVDIAVNSVTEIRRHLVGEIGRLPADGDLAMTLRSMAAACRAFLDEVQTGPTRHHWDGPFGWGFESGAFHEALGQFRGQMGVYLSELVKRFGLTLHGPLAAILPPPPEPAVSPQDGPRDAEAPGPDR
jgi:hypothetical protein